MKNRLFHTIILLFACGVCTAAEIGAGTRREMGRMLTRIVSREVAGTSVQVQAVKASKKQVQIYASRGLAYYPFREENTQAMLDSVRALLPGEYAKARIELYSDGREVRNLIPMFYRTAAPAKKKGGPIPFVNRSEHPLVTPLSRQHAPTRGLSGRHIALWQSHGRYFDQPENRWRWQRVRLWETCEDLYTQSYVLPYLVPMLEHAGACVMLPRERDVQLHEALADNDAPEQYREEGSWSDGGPGFAHLHAVYRTGENPFRHGTTRRTTSVASGEPESRAVWRAEIPERGEYAVYVSYESTPQSADDANYTVAHLGGRSSFSVNQTMGGGTWIYLGRFLFDAGEQEVVVLSNRSRQAGRTVSADAVKIGGGFGNIARSTCDSLRRPDTEYLEETSGYPRFCEGARYWLQWAGFDEKVYAGKNHKDDYKEDYMSRAHWVNALMGGSERLPDSAGLRIPVDLALAFHSDAGVRDGDETIGTLGIFYTRENHGRFQGGADRYRSRDLTDIVMTQIVGDIRRGFEPEWNRRGLWNRAYYEARIPSAPTMLLELLSHQNFADMRYGSDPRFKFFVSRAIYKGILRYISSQYGTPYVVQPLPVEAFGIEFSGDDAVRLRWSPVLDSLEASAVPTGYVVYTRRGDGGFDDGRRVDEPTITLRQEPGVRYSYRVTAVNEGGESMPSEILSACRMPEERGRVLVVNGFDRVCAPYSARIDTLAGFYRDIDPGVPDRADISFVGPQRIFDLSQARNEREAEALGACFDDFETDVLGGNTFDYPALHGRSIAAAGYSYCSASAKAVERGEIPLAGYDAIDLILGLQRPTTVARGVRGEEFPTFSPELRHALRRAAADGGALFVSGSYVTTDLHTDEEQAFAAEVLHVAHDDGAPAQGGRVRVVTSRGGFSRGDYRYHDTPGREHYAVATPDALSPADREAFAVMRYAGNGRMAGIASDAGRTFVLGFPFEALRDEQQRDRLMRDVLHFLIRSEKP
ncbi:MAG: xanthan lyase [Alistipes sp.]|nr:xanthan lyase [Alistipes sp.]